MSHTAASAIPFNSDNIMMQEYLLISVEEVENIYNAMQFVPDSKEDTQIEKDSTPTCNSLNPPDQDIPTRQPVKTNHTNNVNKSKKNINTVKCRTCGKYSNTYEKAMKYIQRMYRIFCTMYILNNFDRYDSPNRSIKRIMEVK